MVDSATSSPAASSTDAVEVASDAALVAVSVDTASVVSAALAVVLLSEAASAVEFPVVTAIIIY